MGDENRGFLAIMENFNMERLALIAGAPPPRTRRVNAMWPRCDRHAIAVRASRDCRATAKPIVAKDRHGS